ncbi:MAG TPA: hypothetical protein PLQ93_05935 [Bacteroidia bacterium]|nr:hypothetical protein [Bacteroidia bacterium]
MKSVLLQGWTTWRFVKLSLGAVFTIAGLMRSDYILAAGGLYLFAMSLFNRGCAGGQCGI